MTLSFLPHKLTITELAFNNSFMGKNQIKFTFNDCWMDVRLFCKMLLSDEEHMD